MNCNQGRHRLASSARRRVVGGVVAAAAMKALPIFAAAPAELPNIPELAAMLRLRPPARGRLVLDVPRIAEDGNTVPAKITMAGPFPSGAHVTALALFSERNPVHTIFALDFPQPVARMEFETRIRLAGTQRLVAVAALADDSVHVATAEVEVAASACVDGS